MAKFSAHFGSKQDAQRVHQNTCTMLKQHLNSNCMNYTGNSVTRRAEMILILQNAVDKMLDEDGSTTRPKFNAGDDV